MSKLDSFTKKLKDGRTLSASISYDTDGSLPHWWDYKIYTWGDAPCLGADEERLEKPPSDVNSFKNYLKKESNCIYFYKIEKINGKYVTYVCSGEFMRGHNAAIVCNRYIFEVHLFLRIFEQIMSGNVYRIEYTITNQGVEYSSGSSGLCFDDYKTEWVDFLLEELL